MKKFFSKIFGGKKKADVPPPLPEPVVIVPTPEPNEVYNSTVAAHGISRDGGNFYEVGHNVVDENEAKSYTETFLVTLFKKIELDLLAIKAQYVNKFEALAAALRLQISKHQDNLNESIEGSYLKTRRDKIARYEKRMKDNEKMISPDEELHRMMEDTTNAQGDEKKQENPGNELNQALNKRNKFVNAMNFLKEFYNGFARLSPTRHSLLFPPDPRYIKLFYRICLFLIIAEFGFSITIVNNVINTGVPWLDPFFSFIYAIAMSLSFAVIFKILIDQFLFRGKGARWCFFLIAIAFFLFLIMVFSYNKRAGSNQTIMEIKTTYRSIMLAFFSVFFAIANAMTFREASYLHHLRVRLSEGINPQVLAKECEDYIATETIAANTKQKQLGLIEATQAQFEKEIFDIIQNSLQALLQLSIKQFMRGHLDRLREIIPKNQELLFLLYKKLISNFNNESSDEK